MLGGKEASYWIPKSGFIDALEYNSPKDLADHLLKVGSDEILYNKFFEWKKYLRYKQNPPKQGFICEMCIQLNLEEKTGIIPRKTLNNMKDYFGVKNNCKGLTKDFKFVTGENIFSYAIMSRETPDESLLLENNKESQKNPEDRIV